VFERGEKKSSKNDEAKKKLVNNHFVVTKPIVIGAERFHSIGKI
jgi:hypothetical protein